MDNKSVWYCVIGATDLKLVYLGKNQVEAKAASRPNTYCATASTMGESQRIAAIEAGRIKSRAKLIDA